MAKLSLIIPMAGRGSRFARLGIKEPKPLINLDGYPFFWWATQSIVKITEIDELIMVVLKEHINEFAIDKKIHEFYPNAKIIALDDVTNGAAETAAYGIAALKNDGPFAVNDCDHAFELDDIDTLINRLNGEFDGALVGFKSNSPNYSYINIKEINNDDIIINGTIEKQVISPFAIAGCYFFKSKKSFENAYKTYVDNCTYDETFMSGVYNILCANDGKVCFKELKAHISFGTPEEIEQIDDIKLAKLRGMLRDIGE